MKRALLLPWLLAATCFAEPTVISEKRSFLGGSGEREWKDFDKETPDGPGLTLTFNSHPNAAAATLRIRQRDVKLRWAVLLNGKKIGGLELYEALLESVIAVPPGALREG